MFVRLIEHQPDCYRLLTQYTNSTTSFFSPEGILLASIRHVGTEISFANFEFPGYDTQSHDPLPGSHPRRSVVSRRHLHIVTSATFDEAVTRPTESPIANPQIPRRPRRRVVPSTTRTRNRRPRRVTRNDRSNRDDPNITNPQINNNGRVNNDTNRQVETNLINIRRRAQAVMHLGFVGPITRAVSRQLRNIQQSDTTDRVEDTPNDVNIDITTPIPTAVRPAISSHQDTPGIAIIQPIEARPDRTVRERYRFADNESHISLNINLCDILLIETGFLGPPERPLIHISRTDSTATLIEIRYAGSMHDHTAKLHIIIPRSIIFE